MLIIKTIPYLKPSFKYNNIPIILMASEYYVAYCCVLLASIIENCNKSYNYDIIILETTISDNNKRILKNTVINLPNFSLNFYNPQTNYKGFNFYFANDTNPEKYYRILAPYFLINYDKAICLDCDLVLNCDISLLFKISLENYLIGAVKDSFFYGLINGYDKELTNYYSLNKYNFDLMNYVNTGVMVMNLSGIRKEYSSKSIINYLCNNGFKFPEQDSINLFFKSKIKCIDPSWNVFTYCEDYYFNCLSQFAPYHLYREYLKARKSPNIIHYARGIKPWQKPDEDMAERFWYYAKKSMLYEVISYRLSYDVSHSTLTQKISFTIRVKSFCKLLLTNINSYIANIYSILKTRAEKIYSLHHPTQIGASKDSKKDYDI